MEEAQPSQIKWWARLRCKREDGAAVLFGKDEVFELGQKLSVRAVFATDKKLFEKAPEGPRFLCPQSRWKQISGVDAKEGIGIEIDYEPLVLKKARRLVICDGIRDPGNLGAIIRSARAFNFDGMLFLGECTDICNDKVLRASKGQALFMPHKYGLMDDLEGYAVIAADSGGENISSLKWKEPLALAFGNEGAGVSDKVLKQAKKVRIEMSNGVESLNVGVAAGILMHEATK